MVLRRLLLLLGKLLFYAAEQFAGTIKGEKSLFPSFSLTGKPFITFTFFLLLLLYDTGLLL